MCAVPSSRPLIEIAPAVADDIPRLAALLEALFTQELDFAPHREKQERGLELILNDGKVGKVFVAREGSIVVGMVSLLFTVSTAEGGRVCWLEDLIVLGSHRGRGVGSRLLETAITYAQDAGFLRITLLTDRINSHALRFYARHGFAESAMAVLRLTLPSPSSVAKGSGRGS